MFKKFRPENSGLSTATNMAEISKSIYSLDMLLGNFLTFYLAAV